jgi:lysophospholipase L1-like esterase
VRKHRLLVALAGLAIALLLIEGLVRLRQWRRYGTTLTTYYRFAEDPASGLRIPEPGQRTGPIEVDSRGFRGPEIEVPKPAGRVRLAFVGGSTTFCAEASSFATTWPELVLAGLRETWPAADLDAVNGGGGGFTTRESLRSLEVRIAPLAPDVIVIYHATNDLVHDTRAAALEQGLYRREEGAESALGQYWLTWYLVEKNLRSLAGERRGAAQRMALDTGALERTFRADLLALVERARALAPVVALVTFSTKIRADQSPEVRAHNATSARFYMPFLDDQALLEGYAACNRVIRAVAAETGVLLVEGEDTIPGDDEHFADTVHLRDPGLRLQADRVLEGLRGHRPLRELLGDG